MNDEAEVMEPEVEVNPMQTFVDDILSKNFAGAQTTFNDLLGAKLNDALDAEKVALAQQVYNGAEPDEDQLELDLEDGEADDDVGVCKLGGVRRDVLAQKGHGEQAA